jgi:hypothetical protein
LTRMFASFRATSPVDMRLRRLEHGSGPGVPVQERCWWAFCKGWAHCLRVTWKYAHRTLSFHVVANFFSLRLGILETSPRFGLKRGSRQAFDHYGAQSRKTNTTSDCHDNLRLIHTARRTAASKPAWTASSFSSEKAQVSC